MSAGAAVIGAAISAGSSLLGTHMRNEAQKRESELAYQRERAAIKEQNAYNSASAQVARLQAAGLNPNLMYEQSQEASAGTQSDFPRYQPADIQNPASPMGAIGADMIQSMIGLKDIENKTALTKADIALKSIQGLREMADTDKTSEEVRLLAQQWGFNESMNPLLLQETKGKISNLDANRAKIYKELDLYDAQINELVANTKLKETEVLKILTLLGPEREKLVSEIKVLSSQFELNQANVQLAFQNSAYLREKTWEVSQRLFLDKWNIEQNLNIAEKDYILKADALSEQVREFDRTNAREWTKYGTDTFFKVADLIIELVPLLSKSAKIGF